MQASVGDRVTIESIRVGSARRTGEILTVIDGPGGQHYRVRWSDGHETTLYPSSDATVAHPDH